MMSCQAMKIRILPLLYRFDYVCFKNKSTKRIAKKPNKHDYVNMQNPARLLVAIPSSSHQAYTIVFVQSFPPIVIAE